MKTARAMRRPCVSSIQRQCVSMYRWHVYLSVGRLGWWSQTMRDKSMQLTVVTRMTTSVVEYGIRCYYSECPFRERMVLCDETRPSYYGRKCAYSEGQMIQKNWVENIVPQQKVLLCALVEFMVLESTAMIFQFKLNDEKKKTLVVL